MPKFHGDDVDRMSMKELQREVRRLRGDQNPVDIMQPIGELHGADGQFKGVKVAAPVKIDGDTVWLQPAEVIVMRERERSVAIFRDATAAWEWLYDIGIYSAVVDSVANAGRGRLLKDNLKGKVGLLWGAFGEYMLVMDKFKEKPDPEIVSGVLARLEGIRRALNEGDDGEYLRENAAKQPLFAMMKTIRDSMKRAGLKIPEKEEDAIGWICAEAITIWVEEKGITQVEAAQSLYDRMEQRQVSLKGLELKAWRQLEEWEKTDLAGNVWKNARRRGLVPDEKRT